MKGGIMTDERYEGFTNYKTWNVCLWFDNDEPLYRARQAWIEENGRFNQQKAREFVMAMLPKGTGDIKNYAGVNWQEVSEAFNGD
jgi:hypothetical protein